MLSILEFSICILFATSTTVLLHFIIKFVKFAKADNEATRIVELNKTVDNILKYKEREKDPIIIEVTDYEIIYDDNNVINLSDDLIDQLLKNRLVYREDINAWVKIKRRRN
tara:strand:+ start:2014 stop:2346 length:333 start_codon:yes stop_codon:yes gene_type:complete